MLPNDDAHDLALDPTSLYREEVFTDRRVGTIRRLTPVSVDGAEDPARPVEYVGQAQIMTPVGTMPLSFQIHADSLADAIDKYAEAANEAIERTARELQEMQREAASSLVLPDSGRGGLGGGGGIPGGGIQLR